MRASPVISIITSVLNRYEFISSALESILSQSYKHVEIIVVDGGSTDGTLEVLGKYKDRISVFVSEPDKGIYDALNKGVSLASGDIVGFLHSDDVFFDNKSLIKIAAAFQEDSVGAVYGDMVYVEKGDLNKIIRQWKAGPFSTENFSRGWMPPHTTFYMRKSLYDRYGGYSLNYSIAADYEAILRYLSSGQVCVKYIPEYLVKMRVGGASNNSLMNLLKKYCENYRILTLYGYPGHRTTIRKFLGKIFQFNLFNVK